MGYADEVLADSPAVYLPLQETSGTALSDLSGNGLNSVLSNGDAATAPDGTLPPALGRGIRLDGTDDHITFPSSNWFFPAGGFTFEGWFYVRSIANWQRLFDFSNTQNYSDITWGRQQTTTKMFIGIQGGANVDVGFHPSLNAWHHVVLTLSNTGSGKVYTDGVETGSFTATVPTNYQRQYKYVGKSAYNADAYNPMSVSHVAVYNSVLSAQRVAAHYNAGMALHQEVTPGVATEVDSAQPVGVQAAAPTPPATPPITAGLTAYFDAQELALSDGAAVATWPDLSGNDLHATQATSGSRPTFSAAGASGKPGVRFQSGKHLLAPVETGDPAQTVFVVLQPEVLDYGRYWGGYGGFGLSTTASDFGGVMYSTRTGIASLQITANSPTGGKYTVGELDQWTSYYNSNKGDGWRKNGAVCDLYSDSGYGLSTGSTAVIGGGAANSNGDIDPYPFNGYICAILHYDVVLSQADTELVEDWLAQRWGGTPATVLAVAEVESTDQALPIVAAQNTRELGVAEETNKALQIHKTPFEPVIAEPTTYEDVVVGDSPLGYWRLGDAPELADASGNRRHGTYTGTLTRGVAGLLAGDADTAVDFDNGEAAVSNATWMNVGSALSVEFLASFDSIPGEAFLVGRDDANSLRAWHIRHQGGWLKFELRTSGGMVTVEAASGFVTGVTYHIAATYDGATARLYVDGAQIASIAASGTVLTPNEGITIGRSGYPHSPFFGKIDEVAIYGTALSAARVDAHYDAVSAGGYDTEVLTDTPLAYYRMSDAASIPADDLSGNGYDGTYSGAITRGVVGLLTDDEDDAADFDGGEVDTPVPVIGGSALTVEAWFKTETLSGNQVVVSRSDYGSGANSAGYAFDLMLIGSAMRFGLGTPDGGWIEPNVAGAVAVGETYHAVLRYDGTTLKGFLNGVEIVSVAKTGTLWPGTNSRLTIARAGGSFGYFPFFGKIDEVAVYDRALSVVEIEEHYAVGTGSGGASGPQSVEVKQAVEIDEAVAFDEGTTSAILGRASEVDTARKIGRGFSLRHAAEMDEALPIIPLKEPDPFSRPRIIFGEEGSLRHDMSDGTLEPGEPNPNGAERSSWFQWEPPDHRIEIPQRFHTRTSNADTTITVFTGESLGALTEIVAEDDSTNSGTAADVTFTPLADTVYWIQVGSKGPGAPTDVALTWLPGEPESYDSFSTPLEIDGSYGSEELTLVNGTIEAGEAAPVGHLASSWMAWVAPSEERASFSVRAFDGLPFTVGVFTGASVGSLAQVASVSGSDVQTVSFTPTEGVTYYIRVSAGDDLGEYEISWKVESTPVPPQPLPYPYEDPNDPLEIPAVRLRAEVYEADGTTFVSEVPRRFGVQIREALNVAGTGSIAVQIDDPVMQAYPDLFKFGRIVKFFLGSKCIHGFEVKERRTTYVNSSEFAGFVREVNGPSVQYLMDYFIVKHDGAPRPDSQDVRFYSWASKKDEWYNESDWNANIDTWSLDNPPSNKKKNKPKNWKVRNARWMAMEGQGGWRYYRKSVHIKESGTIVRLFCSADEFYTVFLDGEKVMEDKSREVGYTKFKKYDTVLDRGWHVIGIFARSLSSKRGDGNDSVLFAMSEVDISGKIIRPALMTSDGTWEGVAVGKKGSPPGWNRAEVLRNVVREAALRMNEFAIRLEFGFTNTHDSEGKAWPKENYNQEVQIGTTCLDLQAQLSEGNGFDVWVDPEDLHIKAYNRRGKDLSASVTLSPGRNLLDWSVVEREEVRNDFLLQFDGGWTEYKAKGSAEDYGSKEAKISLGSVKEEQSAQTLMKRAASGIARAQNRAGTSDIRKKPVGQPDGGLIGVKGAYPFIDFNVGDVVKGPNSAGKLVPVRTLALSLTEDSEGNLSFDPELEEIKSVG